MIEEFLSSVPAPARVPTLVGLVGILSWAFLERFLLAHQRQPRGESRDRGTFWLISSVWTVALSLSAMDGVGLRATTLPPLLSWVQFVGIPFLICGLGLRILARLALGKQFCGRVQTSRSHKLVTAGIYATIRHPAYLGSLGLLVGIPLCFGSVAGLAIAVVTGLPALVYRIRIEEQALQDWFGTEYAEYAKRTKKMIPRLW